MLRNLFGRDTIGRDTIGRDTPGASIQNIDVRRYRDEFTGATADAEGSDHVLLDVRTVAEFMDARLPGAINIPLHALPGRVDEVPQGKPVVVVCRSGNRSMVGARILQQAGYETVYNLQGGTLAWARHGFPVER